MILRPLTHDDETLLQSFLANLGPATKEVYRSHETATELCDAIDRYDKLRFVLEDSRTIVGLFEYSFDITEGDIDRYTTHGIRLYRETDCRFAPCLADEYQNRGIGADVFDKFKDLAPRFGQRRIILLGGVFVSNTRAIRFYEKVAFVFAGRFVSEKSKKTSQDMILDLESTDHF